MSSLYAQDALPFDVARARASCEWLLEHPDSGAIWLLEVDGVQVGYLILTVCVSIEFGGRFALLDELYIEAPWRGRGIARQAIEFAEGWARDRRMSALRLETAVENAHAIHVYSNSGFSIHSRHLMTKWL